MYNFNTSIHRLLHDKLISSFTHHKLEALSLLTVGDIKAMGMEKLSAMPRIGKKIVYDVKHVFAAIESQDPLLEVKRYCSDEVIQKMDICYAHLCENVEDGKEFQAIFPSSLEILKLICINESNLMEMVDNYPQAASCLYIYLVCLKSLILDDRNDFYYSVKDSAMQYRYQVGSKVLGMILYSHLSNKSRLLLESHYSVMEKFFGANDFIQLHPFIEDRLTYELGLSEIYSTRSLDKEFCYDIEFKLKYPLNSYYSFSLITHFVDAYTSLDFEHSGQCTIGLFPFMSDKSVSFVTDFHQVNGYYPMFTLFSDYLQFGMWNEGKKVSLEYRGIGRKRKTSQELREEYHITPYILKNYLSHPMVKSTDPIILDEHWKCYDFLYEMPFIGFFSPICRSILEKERLQTDAIGLMELIFLRNPGYPSNKQFRKFESKNRFILVNASLFDTDEIAKLVTKMKELLAINRFTDEHYQASMFLKELDVQKLGGKEHFLSFFTYLMLETFGLEVDDEGGFVAERNKVSVTSELLEILKERGKPMRAEEMRDIFHRRCPAYRHLTVNTIRVYLNKMEGVKSLGLSGYYGLASWEHIYWGTMVDKIYEVLSLAGKPLPLSDIYQQVKVFFPNSTKSSMESSMRLDARHRFKYDVERHAYVLVDHAL